MTSDRELMQMALDALETYGWNKAGAAWDAEDAKEALRNRLAQRELDAVLAEREAVKKIALDILHNQLRDARFDDRQHLGLGDVRYTVGMENEFELELIEACEVRGNK